jgi:hypothetical protein
MKKEQQQHLEDVRYIAEMYGGRVSVDGDDITFTAPDDDQLIVHAVVTDKGRRNGQSTEVMLEPGDSAKFTNLDGVNYDTWNGKRRP